MIQFVNRIELGESLLFRNGLVVLLYIITPINHRSRMEQKTNTHNKKNPLKLAWLSVYLPVKRKFKRSRERNEFYLWLRKLEKTYPHAYRGDPPAIVQLQEVDMPLKNQGIYTSNNWQLPPEISEDVGYESERVYFICPNGIKLLNSRRIHRLTLLLAALTILLLFQQFFPSWGASLLSLFGR